MNLNIRPLQHQAPANSANPSSPVRPAGVAPGTVPPQRPLQQQQPRTQAPTPAGQQPPQFADLGRPSEAPFNNGSQGQLRSGMSSPQAQPSLAMRPPPMQLSHRQQHQQQQHQQQQQAHQPLVNGENIRPSASHPNLTGSGPGMPPGNSMAHPSPNVAWTRSPQIRPLQQTQQSHGNGPMPQHHQPQQPHHQPNLRPSASHPHLAQQAGIRPPPTQGSPVLAHQTAIRPPTPLMQHQPRPRPTQAAPHSHSSSPFSQTQHIAPGHSVQLDMPSMNGGQASTGVPSPHQRPDLPLSQDMHEQQQRSPGARPILDQMRQQTQPSHPTQGPGSTQNHQNMNPAQRPPQHPTALSHTQAPRQQQQRSGSVPLSPQRPPTKETHTSSPLAHVHGGHPIDTKASHGERGRAPNVSPQQHNNTLDANQRPANLQTAPGARLHPQQDLPGLAGFSRPHHSPRPLQAPGSPAQRPLGAKEIKLPGPAPNMASRQAPVPQQLQQLHHQQQLQRQKRELEQTQQLQLQQQVQPQKQQLHQQTPPVHIDVQSRHPQALPVVSHINIQYRHQQAPPVDKFDAVQDVQNVSVDRHGVRQQVASALTKAAGNIRQIFSSKASLKRGRDHEFTLSQQPLPRQRRAIDTHHLLPYRRHVLQQRATTPRPPPSPKAGIAMLALNNRLRIKREKEMTNNNH